MAGQSVLTCSNPHTGPGGRMLLLQMPVRIVRQYEEPYLQRALLWKLQRRHGG